MIDHLENFRRVKKAFDALVTARKSSEDAWNVGRDDMDAAIEKQREAMLGIIDRAADVDWCHPDDLTYPVALLNEALQVLGYGGPVARLGGKIGLFFKPVLAMRAD